MQRGDTGGKRREERCTGVHACMVCAVYYQDVLFALRWGVEKVKMKVQKEGEERREVTCRKKRGQGHA